MFQTTNQYVYIYAYIYNVNSNHAETAYQVKVKGSIHQLHC